MLDIFDFSSLFKSCLTFFELLPNLLQSRFCGPFGDKILTNIWDDLIKHHLYENIGVDVEEIEVLTQNSHHQNRKVKVNAVENEEIVYKGVIIVALELVVMQFYDV